MNYILCAFFLAFSLSLDSLAIGASYGIKKIRIPILSILTMSVVTFVLSLLSATVGELLHSFLSEGSIRILSFILLTTLAVSMLIPSKKKPDNYFDINEQKTVFLLFFKWAGLTIQIIKEPPVADKNNSEVIEFKEALCIGLALSLDALCACMGFCIEDNKIILPLLIAVFQFVFMFLGEVIGKRFKGISERLEKITSAIPPIILFLIAVGKLFVNV